MAVADVTASATPWTPSSIMAGVTLVGVGVSFILARPPLLSEDIRDKASSAARLDILRPGPKLWLTPVFSVMGDYVLIDTEERSSDR